MRLNCYTLSLFIYCGLSNCELYGCVCVVSHETWQLNRKKITGLFVWTSSVVLQMTQAILRTSSGTWIFDDPETKRQSEKWHTKLSWSPKKQGGASQKLRQCFSRHQGEVQNRLCICAGFLTIRWIDAKMSSQKSQALGCCIMTIHSVTLHCLCARLWRQRTPRCPVAILYIIPQPVRRFLFSDFKTHRRRRLEGCGRPIKQLHRWTWSFQHCF